MNVVANAKKVRLEAAELLSQAQAREQAGAAKPATTYTRVGSILVPTTAPTAQPSEANKALEDAAVKLADAHAKLAAIDVSGPMTMESLAISAEMRACMAGLAAITAYLSSANLMAGAAAALEGRTFRKTEGGLWVPAKAA